MIVYSYWDSSPAASEHQAALCALWRRSWLARGWEPRLLQQRDAFRSDRYRAARKLGPVPDVMLPDFALHYVTGGSAFLCPFHCINFLLKPPCDNVCAHTEFFGYAGWERAAVVDFDRGATPEKILSCGREI